MVQLGIYPMDLRWVLTGKAESLMLKKAQPHELLQLTGELKSSSISVVEVHPLEGWHILLCPKDFPRDVKTIPPPAFLY